MPKTIKFNLTKVTNPFSSGLSNFKLTFMTNDGYLRMTGNYSLQIDSGVMNINSFTCTTYQIGYKSSCKLNFTTSNAIFLTSQIRLIYPTSGWMTAYSGSNTVCSVVSSSPQINSIFQCRYQDTIKSFVFTQLTNWTNITTLSPFTAIVSIEQSSVDVDNRILLPWDVSTYSLSLTSYSSDNLTIDTGLFSITTVKR